MKLRSIYTEKIHHIECAVSNCDEYTNTNDESHKLSKRQAAKSFEIGGWRWIKRIGWLCPNCLKKRDEV